MGMIVRTAAEGVSEEALFSPVGANVSDDIQQLGMLNVYKPDTKAPIGSKRKAKAKTPSTA